MVEAVPWIDQLAQQHPNDWIIELGTNDAGRNNPSWELPFLDIWHQVRSSGCVIYLSVSQRAGPIATQINASLDGLARAHANVHILDWGNLEYLNPAWLEPDMIHPTPAGQTELAALETQELMHSAEVQGSSALTHQCRGRCDVILFRCHERDLLAGDGAFGGEVGSQLQIPVIDGTSRSPLIDREVGRPGRAVVGAARDKPPRKIDAARQKAPLMRPFSRHARLGRLRHAERRRRTSPSRSRSTSPTGCPASPSSACPTPPCARHATACGPPSCPAACPGRCAGSPSTWRPRACAKGGAGLDLPDRRRAPRRHRRAQPRAAPRALAFCGELGLNGSLRHVPGMIALADATAPARAWWCRCATCARPRSCAASEVHGAATLAELARVLRGQADWPDRRPAPPPSTRPGVPDLADVRGQAVGRRALEVAAAGSPPPPHDRAARLGQDDAGRAPGRAAPAAHAPTRRSR